MREKRDERWREKEMKIKNEGGNTPYGRNLEREEREREQLYLWSQFVSWKKMWVPKHGPIAQCFNYIGIIIPRYTIINFHFLTLGKIIYQK